MLRHLRVTVPICLSLSCGGKVLQGLPWQSSGEDSTLLFQGAWVRSLLEELRSHKLSSAAKYVHTGLIAPWHVGSSWTRD